MNEKKLSNPWKKKDLENPLAFQPVNKPSSLYGNRMFIIAFARVLTCSYPEPN